MSQQSSYSKKQIAYIMELKVEGLTYKEIAQKFNRKFNEERTVAGIKDAFTRYAPAYDLPEFQKHPERVREEKTTELMNLFIDFIAENQYIPTQRDLDKIGLTSKKINNFYTNFDKLEKMAREQYPNVFENIIDVKAFTEGQYQNQLAEIKKYKRFVITSAVTGCKVHTNALDALKNYCKRNNAKLLVLPCSDPASATGHRHEWSLDSALDKQSVVFKDINLNDNVFLSTIKLSAKHINPLTGLSRIGQRHGSFIYASPKQALEYVATSMEKKIPRALMTTGAITKPNYSTNLYMSERTAYIADHDHILGAIIVELENEKLFYFRQIQFNKKTGAFYDLDKKYLADGSVVKSTADLVQLGDYHVGETDPMVRQVAKDICNLVKPKYLTVEDFFNGHSVSHHDEGKCITQAKKSIAGADSLEVELKACSEAFSDICSWNVAQVIVKYGNHEDFLRRWLERAGYIYQPINHRLGVKLADALFDDKAPIEFAMRELYPVKGQEKLKFLKVNDSFVVNKIENGVHGHLGASGSRNPGLEGIEKAYGAANVGHTHSAGILRSVFRVGTSTFLKVGYNDGPSSWTQTHLIQHPDGSRQLINCIHGKFRLKD